MASKYQPLYVYLSKSKKTRVELTPEEVAKILGLPLPRSSASTSWWSNDPSGGHPQSFAWVDAGFSVLGIEKGRIIFKK